MKNKRNFKDDLLTKKIIGACYDVHNELGPGFVEKIYLKALKLALDKVGVLVNFVIANALLDVSCLRMTDYRDKQNDYGDISL